MTHPVIHRHRPLHGALTAGAVLLSLGGAGIAAADDLGRDRDGRDRYYYHDGDDDRYGASDGYGGVAYDRHDHDRYEKHGKRSGKHDQRYGRYDGGGYYYYAPPAYRSDGYYQYYDRGYQPAPFVVPRHLYRRDYGAYDPYYGGTVYYAPHHHAHRIYYFPVIVGGYTEYRPFAYCEGAFFPEQYGYPGPRGSFGFQFGY